jgi:sugar O-acyltransferase (sialic acid O-acetyltransferase NeuD family)
MSEALRPLILWGAAGHAKVLAEFLSVAGFQPIAVFDIDPAVVDSPLPHVTLFKGRQAFDRWCADWCGSPLWGIAAIGGSRGEDRLEIHAMFLEHGIRVPTLVHPRGFVASTASLAEGTQVLVNAAVCADTTLGKACIVNTAASVDHECILGDGVHIGPGAHLAGCVEAGRCAFIGAGAVVLPRVRIGANTIVGAGAVVTRDVPDGVVVHGNPARVARVLEKAK